MYGSSFLEATTRCTHREERKEIKIPSSASPKGCYVEKRLVTR